MLNTDVQDIEPHENAEIVVTGKGGVGKSTVAAHLAGRSAAEGVPTLLVCITGQEDDDFGITKNGRGEHPEGESVLDGEGLYRAVHDRGPLRPIRGVRPNLDVVPGGNAVGRVQQLLTLRQMEEGLGVYQSLAYSLSLIGHRYGRIILDGAPENDALEQLALGAARRLWIPTRSDESSILGIKRIAKNFHIVRKRGINSRLELGGAFLYGSNPSATSIHAMVREEVLEILGPNARMLSTVVGYREKPAMLARKRGLLFGELAELLPTSPKSYDVAAGRAKDSDVIPEASVKLAGDMMALTTEIFEAITKAQD
ncbi:ParA family protein [Kitasatospora sp. NPDC058965]|uniref:ParA family protein n=1 Tax=Kitasatospora sp. NPDC058965 TaxID=3346682 RepID=UPI0036AEE369